MAIAGPPEPVWCFGTVARRLDTPPFSATLATRHVVGQRMPTSDELLLLGNGNLSRQRADQVAAHVERCDRCRRVLRQTQQPTVTGLAAEADGGTDLAWSSVGEFTESPVSPGPEELPKHAYETEYAPLSDCPANLVTWYEAAAYCNWLNEQEGIPRDEWCYAPNEAGP